MGSLWVKVGVFWVFYRRGCFLWVLFHSYLLTIRWFLGVFDDHYCESTLFWLIIGLKANSWVWKGSFRNTTIVGKGWSADEERWSMGI